MEYARRIYEFSQIYATESPFCGVHYFGLCHFLIIPIKASYKGDVDPAEVSADFISVLELGHTGIKARRFVNVHDFDAYCSDREHQNTVVTRSDGRGLAKHATKPDTGLSSSQIVFLRGQPSPKWIWHVGAQYDLNPELFCQHMETPSPGGWLSTYNMPPLSSLTGVLQLHLTSLVRYNHFRTDLSMEEIREGCVQRMNDYLSHLTSGKNVSFCDSVVRSFDLIDDEYFSIGQLISINLRRINNSWTCAYSSS